MGFRRAGFRLLSLTPVRKYLYYRYNYSFRNGPEVNLLPDTKVPSLT